MCEKDWFAQDVHKIWDFFSVIRPTKRKARVSRHKRNRFRHQPSEQSASFIIDKKSIIWEKHLNKQVINFTNFFFEYKKTPKQTKKTNFPHFIFHYPQKKNTKQTKHNLFSPYLIFHYKNKKLQTEKQSHSSFYLPSSRERK